MVLTMGKDKNNTKKISVPLPIPTVKTVGNKFINFDHLEFEFL